MSASARAWRCRLIAAAAVAVVLALARIAEPGAALRSQALYLGVVCIGYGHLLGGLVFARRRIEACLPSRLRSRGGFALLGSSSLVVLLLYLEAIRALPVLVLPVLAVSVWHTFENDLLLRDLHCGKRAPPLPRCGSHHLAAFALSGLAVMLFTAATPPAGLPALGAPGDFVIRRGAGDAILRTAVGLAGILLWRRGRHRPVGLLAAAGVVLLPQDVSAHLDFAEVFAAWSLYHVFSWAVLAVEQAWVRDSAGRRSRLLALALVHGGPGMLGAALLAAPVGWEHPARAWVFSPAPYLFWASLHVVQTLWVRGLESPRSPAATIRGAT